MTTFVYTGLNAAGKKVKGEIDALTERAALDRLNTDSITPVEIKKGRSETEAPSGGFMNYRRHSKRIPAAVRTIFVRELATFVHADIPLLDALNVMRQQEEHPGFKFILNQIHNEIQGGDSFSDALRKHPGAFPPLLVSMVRVGETGGILGKVLDQMADWMESEEEVKGDVRGAMAYPAMIVVMGVATVIFIMTFVMPKILPLFAGMEGGLPLPTKILIGATAVIGKGWWAILLGLVGLVVAVRQGRKTAAGKVLSDKVVLFAPIFGDLAQKSIISRFTRSTAALLSAGVPLLESLKVVRGLVGNSVMVAMVDNTIGGVTRGESLARKLSESPFFPSAMVHLIGVGERTGRLDEMFNRVAESFEKQTRQRIKMIVNLLTPILIICLAVGVAFIAIAILLPIFKMNQSIR